MLNNNPFGSLIVVYDQDIENAVTDLGSITLTETVSGRSFILDVLNYHKHNDKREIECHLDDITEVMQEFDGAFDLTQEDLSLDTLQVEYYCGDDSDCIIPVSGYLIAFVNGETIMLEAKPD